MGNRQLAIISIIHKCFIKRIVNAYRLKLTFRIAYSLLPIAYFCMMMEATESVNSFPDLPKPVLEEKKDKINIWVKSLGSLALYLALGYFFFSHRWVFLLIITAIIIFHELGHFTAMKIFKYNDLGIFFIPLLGAYVSGSKQEVSQKQSAIILLAGPVPGIVIGMFILIFLKPYAFTQLWITANFLIFLNLLNLLPIYPLDGGQLLHRLFLDDFKIIGKIFMVISIALLAYIAISTGFYILLLFPFIMVTRMLNDTRHEKLISHIEAQGIDLTKSYEQLTAQEYWQIRNILINTNPEFRRFRPAPPYEISEREDDMITAIQNLLQRSVVQDLSLVAKLAIMCLWIACFLVPFVLDINPGDFIRTR